MLVFYNLLFIELVWSWWTPVSRIVWIRSFNSARWGSLLAVLTWERHTGAADVSSAHPVVLTFDLRFSVNPTDSEPTTTSCSKSFPSTLWCAGWTSAGRVYVSECSELLSCDWLMVLWFFICFLPLSLTASSNWVNLKTRAEHWVTLEQGSGCDTRDLLWIRVFGWSSLWDHITK